jgi:PmbA protein
MNEIDKVEFDTEALQAVARDILAEAKRQGATQAEVGIALSKGFSVGARETQVETVEYNQDKVVDIKVYVGKRSGSASLSDLRSEAVNDAVSAACHIAKFTGEDTYSGLADKEEMGFDYPKLQLAYPWSLSVEKAIELACQCEREALAMDKRIMSAEEATVATGTQWNLYANSHGFTGSFAYTRHEISCILVAKGKAEMARDYSYTVAADPAQLDSVTQIAEEAVRRTVNRLGARQLRTMKTPVIFAAEEARGLLGHFVAAIAGSSVYRKSSFLADHLGKQIFPEFVHIQEFPHLPHALGSAPFDNDGVATRSNVFIQDGILQNYILGVYSARRLGMKTTGDAGGIHNLTIQPGTKNLAELLKTMGKGLLVTEMMGNGVNLVTGDYSRGVCGFWVENGEIQYPVHENTVAGHLKDMYARIVEVGKDVDTRGNIRTGSILIEEMTVAGG